MKNRRLVFAVVVVVVVLVVGLFGYILLQQQPPQPAQGSKNYSFTVDATHPHDTSAWTEGLAFSDGILYEGTGEYGTSTVRRVDLQTGDVLQELSLSSDIYGEGITVVGDKIIQLTWLEKVGFVYSKYDFSFIRNFSYSTQGWGLTYDETNLIMSDGSDKLYFLDPSTFQVVRQVSVHDGNESVAKLNELEYVNGDVYANIWLEGKFAIINPQTGQVTGWVNLGDLEGNLTYQANGIAYDQQNSRLYITGKNWPHLYQITLKAEIEQ